MRLEGLHHVTAITADAPRNVDFYARVLGLRLVKKTVNFDAARRLPPVLRRRGRRRRGRSSRSSSSPAPRPAARATAWSTRSSGGSRSPTSLDFWARAPGRRGRRAAERDGDALRFADPEGLRHALVVVDDHRRAARRPRAGHPGRARAARLPRRARLRRRRRARARRCSRRSDSPSGAAALGGRRRRAPRRGSPATRRPPSAGARGRGHRAPRRVDRRRRRRARAPSRRRAADAGARPTPIIDRQYFHSVYFREPGGRALRAGQRATSASTSTSPPSRSARRSSCRRSTSATATSSSARLTPLHQPACHGGLVSVPGTLVHRVRPAAGDPEGALVLLHGRGADENDLFGLLDVLDPERRLVGVTPGGPLFLPPGGRHWYVVPRVGFPDPRRPSTTRTGALDGRSCAASTRRPASRGSAPWSAASRRAR